MTNKQSSTIQEEPGDNFSDLEAVQRDAKPFIAFHLAQIVKELLEAGILIQINGEIVPNTKGAYDRLHQAAQKPTNRR